MTIIEHVKDIFRPTYTMPDGFIQNPTFDAVFLIDKLANVPELLKARNGLTYFYFDDLKAEDLELVRKMGFEPRRHKSRRTFPPKVVFRARVSRKTPRSVWNIVNAVMSISFKDVDECQKNPAYAKYIENYKTKTK